MDRDPIYEVKKDQVFALNQKRADVARFCFAYLL